MSRSIEDHSAGPLIQPVVRPLQKLIHAETAGGILLLGATNAAMVWANSPWAASYTEFWHIPVSLAAGLTR